MNNSAVVECNEEPHDPQVAAGHEDDDNQPHEVEHQELVTNKKQYALQAVLNMLKQEKAELSLYSLLIERVQSMEQIPSTAMDVVHSKQDMVAALQALKDKRDTQHRFFQQLYFTLQQSPDTDETVGPPLPEISRAVWYDRDGNKFYV